MLKKTKTFSFLKKQFKGWNERMNELIQKAVDKLTCECKELTGKCNSMEGVLCAPLTLQLCEFCKQEPEFARAVLESKNKKLSDCLAFVLKGVCAALSDVDAYQKAAQYYFDGARVEQKLILHVNPFEADSTEAKPILKLFDLL
jgi:hypothetical protein